MTRRPVVITGVGPVTALGIGIDPLWQGLDSGTSAIRPIETFVEAGMPCPFGGLLAADELQIRKIVPKSYRKATKVMCRDIELAVAAASTAVADAGLVTKGVNPDETPTYEPARLGCQIGAGLICAELNELTRALSSSMTGTTDSDGFPEFDLGHWGSTGMQDLTPLWLLKYLPNMLACHVTIIHDCRGPSNTITCTEASSALSLGESMRVIERGAADACLTGGAETRLNPMAFMRQVYADRIAEATADADPGSIVRPYDPAATGTVLGEGGGIIVVEAEETAAARGATPYCRVAGFAATQSFCADTIGLHIDPDDPGIEDAIAIALQQAGVDPGDVDAIAPFGSGIPHVDACEQAAIERVFGDTASSTPLITVTPNVGTCNAGHGAVCIAAAARAIREQRLPARLNGPAESAIDASACDARDAALGTVLVTVCSHGGQNAAIVLKKI